MASNEDRKEANQQKEMVTLSRRAIRTPPSTETSGQSPSLVPSSDEEAEDCRRQQETIQTALRVPLATVIDGEYWPPIFTAENVRSAKAMQPRPTDVFIATYPKCGTTWIQHIVHQLLDKTEYEQAATREDDNKPSSSRGENEEEKKAMCFVSPMIERMGASYSDTIKTPRVLKTHFTYENIPKGGNARYIYAVRNPKDCLTSYFKHHQNFKLYNYQNGSFDYLFELFMKGEVGFGDYFTHLHSWLEGIKKGEEKILSLKYEDMIADPTSAIIKIGNFLGGISAEIVRDEEKLKKIVEASSLQSMKENQGRWFPPKQLTGDFIGKGGSRNWWKQFTPAQSDRMDALFRERCTGTEAENWWRWEMDPPKEPSKMDTRRISLNISDVSSYSSSATSGFYSASPCSFTPSSLDVSSLSSSRLRFPSFNPDSLCCSPLIDGPLDRDRVDSLQFPLEGLKLEESTEEE